MVVEFYLRVDELFKLAWDSFFISLTVVLFDMAYLTANFMNPCSSKVLNLLLDRTGESTSAICYIWYTISSVVFPVCGFKK